MRGEQHRNLATQSEQNLAARLVLPALFGKVASHPGLDDVLSMLCYHCFVIDIELFISYSHLLEHGRTRK